MIKNKIEKWMLHNWQTKSYKNFDHLHIDELDKSFENVNKWLQVSMLCFNHAIDIRNKINLIFSIDLCFSLRSDTYKIGYNIKTAKDLKNEFDYTPPCLYINSKNLKVWLDTPKLEIQLNDIIKLPKNTTCYFSEYKEEQDNEYRRSIWLSNQ